MNITKFLSQNNFDYMYHSLCQQLYVEHDYKKSLIILESMYNEYSFSSREETIQKTTCGLMMLYPFNITHQYEKTIQIYRAISNKIKQLPNDTTNYVYATRDYIIALSESKKYKNVINSSYELYKFVAQHQLHHYEEILVSLDLVYTRYFEALSQVIKDERSHSYQFAKYQMDVIRASMDDYDDQFTHKECISDVDVTGMSKQNHCAISEESILKHLDI